ncbi:O-antigen ligase family protein [bacterium]|nr:O-antigen ligase family protein [bacterium]
MPQEKLRRWIRNVFIAFFFLLPLLWTPWNFELFEFNKMLFVYLTTVVIASLWLILMIGEKKLIFKKTPLFWPLMLFLGGQILATVFSIDRYTSIFGYYSRLHGGLLSTLSYLVLYWALVSCGEKEWREKIIKAVLLSGILIAGWGVAEHFGVDKDFWVQDVQNRVFSTLGQPNWLAAYLDVLIILALVAAEKKGKIWWGVFSLFYLCLLYTKSRSGLLGLGGGLVFFYLFAWRREKKKKEWRGAFLKSLGIIALLSFLVGTPYTPSWRKLFSRQKTVSSQPPSSLKITPSSEIRKIVWRGALRLWRKYPLVGTGVETFAYTYYWVRPREHNLTSEWDFLYNKAHNEYLNFAANSGTLGLVTYLLILAFYFLWFLKKGRRESLWIIGLGGGLVSLLITNFFGFSVVVTGSWFFFIPALSFLEEKPVFTNKNWRIEKLKVGGLLFLAGYLIFQIIQFWWGDFYLQKGILLEKQNRPEKSLFYLKKALRANPRVPLYHDKMSLTLAKLAAVLHQEGKKEAALQAAKAAIEESDKALAGSPFHLNFYRDRAKMFYILSTIDLRYLERSLQTILRAIDLAPTDAKLYYNAGAMFWSLGEKERGIKYLKRALELKPDYQRAKALLEKWSHQ